MINILFSFVRKIKFFLSKYMKKYYTFRVRRSAKSVGDNLRVNLKSNVSKNTILGNNVNFNGMNISGEGGVKIGNNFHSGKGCLMITQIHNYDHGRKIPYDDTYIYKDVLINDNVWLGSRVIILGGVTIGEGAIIQAGSVVVSDIPDYAVAGGHPAKVFKYRNKEHYDKLKQKKMFH